MLLSPQLCRVSALLLFFSFFRSAVEAQPGFISLDCGLPEGDDYVDNGTQISYVSDRKYVQGGQPKTVKAENFPRRYQTLRVFPDGDRNCYVLRPLQAGAKYLVRAAFFYGNDDGLSSPPQFELHVGVNAKLSVEPSLNETRTLEVVAAADGNRMWACLVNTGGGSPFISAIEVRPLHNLSYPANVSQSLFLQRRLNLGAGAEITLRYPTDAYDRIWSPIIASFVAINSSSPVATRPGDGFQVPSIVMQTAVAAQNVSVFLAFLAAGGDPTHTVYFALHFAELQNFTNANDTSIMDILGQGRFEASLTNYSAPYLRADHVVGSDFEIGSSRLYVVNVTASNTSTLPPFLNALETFVMLKSDQLPTSLADVGAVEDIKAAYKIERNWQGDPCVPQIYVWTGLRCSYFDSSSPTRIVSLNLSSMIAITGEIPPSIVNLTALTSLDLSNNPVSIKALDLLAELPSLETLTLSGIKILGSSQDFCNKAQNGTLSSKIQGLRAVCSPSETPGSTPRANSSLSTKLNYYLSLIMVLILSFTFQM